MAQQPQFGQTLRRLREARGLSQRDLANGLVTPSYISLVESGRRVPTLDVIMRLAAALDVSVAELVGHELALRSTSDRVEESIMLADVLASGASDVRDYVEAAATLTGAVDAARADGNHGRMLEIGMRLQQVLAVLDRRADRVALLCELRDMPGIGISDNIQVLLGTELAAAFRQVGKLADARTAALDAVERLRRTVLRDGDHHAKLLGVLVSVLVEQNDMERAADAVDELLRVAGVGSSGLRGRAHWVAALAYAQMGRGEDARAELEHAHRQLASPTLPLREWMRFCRSSASILLDVDGDLDEIGIWLQNAETSARMLGLPVEFKRVLMLRARYELACGQTDKCLLTTDQILRDSQDMSRTDTIQVRFTAACAIGNAGGRDAAIQQLRALAFECEELASYRLAVRVWREIDQFQSGPVDADARGFPMTARDGPTTARDRPDTARDGPTTRGAAT